MLRSDVVLEQHVAEELAAEPGCRDAAVSVRVVRGVVTLSGHVSTPGCRAAAVRAVRRVFGVEGVDDQLVDTATATL